MIGIKLRGIWWVTLILLIWFTERNQEDFYKKLPDMTGMDFMESLIDTIISFNLLNNFNRILTVTGVVHILSIIALHVLKCALAYLCKNVSQIDRKKLYIRWGCKTSKKSFV